MLFLLKKYLGALLMPLPLLLILGFIGILLLWFTHWQKSGKTCVSISLILITLLGLQPIADNLLSPVEEGFDKRYELITNNPPDNIHYIVVLGGGFTYNPDWSPSSNLLNCGFHCKICSFANRRLLIPDTRNEELNLPE